MCARMFICMCIHMSTHMCMHMSTHMCMPIHMSIHMSVHMSTHVSIQMSIQPQNSGAIGLFSDEFMAYEANVFRSLLSQKSGSSLDT